MQTWPGLAGRALDRKKSNRQPAVAAQLQLYWCVGGARKEVGSGRVESRGLVQLSLGVVETRAGLLLWSSYRMNLDGCGKDQVMGELVEC